MNEHGVVATPRPAPALGDLSSQEPSVPTRTLHLPARQRQSGSRLNVRRWTQLLVGLDLVGGVVGASVGLAVKFGDVPATVLGLRYEGLIIVVPVAWLAVLWLSGSYRVRHRPAGVEEYRSVLRAGAYLLAGVAIASFVSKADLSRTFVAVALPIMVFLTLACRWSTRRIVQRRFARGVTLHRAVVVGEASEVIDLAEHMLRSKVFGFSVVAAVVTSGMEARSRFPVPIISAAVDDLPALVRAQMCDTIAVTASGLQGSQLRNLSWQLEGSGIQLVVAPAVTDIAGPRICIRPVDGLPLLYVDEPGHSGPRAVLKEVFERSFAALLLALLSPVMLAIACAIRLTSRGPVMFRQTRPGLGNETFEILKFRTMFVGPHPRPAETAEDRTTDPVKERRDPRITSVGRLLRRWSLDELPQLWNVVSGDMALVGPRPLISTVAARQDQVSRRLLMKPGMTGLWQVRGRSDLSWDERMRLDLYYVDNWSLALDLMILWKTVSAVLLGRGAY